jgi:hypothetical protein
MHMKYPRLSEKQDLRKKLTKKDILEMQELVRQKIPKSHIAEKFGVSSALVHYHCRGDEYKAEWNRKVKERQKEIMQDENYREKHREVNSAYSKRKRKLIPDFNKYGVERTKAWYNKSEENREKWRENAKKWKIKTKYRQSIPTV